MSDEPTGSSGDAGVPRRLPCGDAGGRNRRSRFDGLLRRLALAGRAVRTPALVTLATQPGSLGAVFQANAARTPDQPALLFEEHRWSWAQVDEVADRGARWFLARGARSGDCHERRTPEAHDRRRAGAIRR